MGETVADELKMSGPFNSFLMNVREDRLVDVALDALNDLGDKRKSKDQDFRACETVVDEPLAKSCVRRLGVRGSFAVLCGNRAGSIGSKETEGRLSSSRTSLIVKAAYRNCQL